jgi:hypothetical protein
MDLLLEFLEMTGRALAFVGVIFFFFVFLSGSGLTVQTGAALAVGAFGLALWMGARWLRSRASPPIT